MKFWELSSVCRDAPFPLEDKLVGTKFYDWAKNFNELVLCQDRLKLDYEIPDDICERVLKYHPGVQYLYIDGILRSRKIEPSSIDAVFGEGTRASKKPLYTELTYLEIFRTFGGYYIEEAREFGSISLINITERR